MAAVQKKMRVKFPRAATRMFGAKSSDAQELLTRIYNDLAPQFSLVHNKVKNGVKIGGLMINGSQHIDVYISYKNADGIGASIGLIQLTAETELIARVGDSRPGNGGPRKKNYEVYKMD